MERIIRINGISRMIDKNEYGIWELYLNDEDIKWLEKLIKNQGLKNG